MKKYHILFIHAGESKSTGINIESMTVTGALRQFFKEHPDVTFLYIASEEMFNFKS